MLLYHILSLLYPVAIQTLIDLLLFNYCFSIFFGLGTIHLQAAAMNDLVIDRQLPALIIDDENADTRHKMIN